MTGLPNPPSYIEYKNWKFLIFDAPTEANLELYLKEMKKHNVSQLARACDPSYPTDSLEASGIKVHELSFPDGGFPSDSVVNSWLDLCKEAFKNAKSESVSIAVHCVAGLGRAPVLVAIALIEQGLKYDDAVNLIREKRRGAINAKQLKWLKSYKPKKACIIM
jgi:protein tyrosine phosphatase type 4A